MQKATEFAKSPCRQKKCRRRKGDAYRGTGPQRSRKKAGWPSESATKGNGGEKGKGALAGSHPKEKRDSDSGPE